MQQTDIDAWRHQALSDGHLLIGGQWRSAEGGRSLGVVSPIDGQTLCQIASASSADVDAAVRSARSAHERGSWSRLAPAERKKVLHRIADRIEAHQMALAVLGVRDNGTEIAMAYKAEPGSATATFRYYAECVDKVMGEIAPTPEGTLGLVHKAHSKVPPGENRLIQPA